MASAIVAGGLRSGLIVGLGLGLGLVVAEPTLFGVEEGSLAAPEGVVLNAFDIGGLEPRSAALLLSGQEGGEIPIRVLAFPLGEAEGVVDTALVVDVAGGALLGDPEEKLLRVEVYAYALGAAGGVQDFFCQAFTLETEEVGELLGAGGVKFLAHLSLPVGDYSLRVLVHLRELDRFGLAKVPLSLTAPASETPPVLAPPLLLERAERWVVVQQGDKEGRASSSLPWLTEGRGVVPAARGVVAGGTNRFLVGVIAETLPTDLALEASRVGEEEALRLDFHSGEGSPSEEAGLMLVEAEVSFSDLAAGEYSLRLLAGDRASAPASLVVLPEAPDGELPLWTQLGAVLFSEMEPMDIDIPAASSAKGWRSSQLSQAYLAAVELLAEGQDEAAQKAIMELEVEGLGSGSQKNFRRVFDSELDVIRRLSASNPHSLVPLTLLHDELYQQYRSGGHLQLSSHSRQFALALGERHAELVPRGRGSGFFDDYLLDRAGKVLESGNYLEAYRLLDRAKETNPDRQEIILALAAIQEALSHYQDAVDLLRVANRLDRKPGEVRLRLAINMVRVGERGNIVSLFESCLEPEAPEWVRTVAFQELARFYRSQGRIDKALAVLERATAEPDASERLFLQLSALLDSAGRPEDARKALTGQSSSPGGDLDSARLRYSEWPLWVFESAATAMARRSSEAMAGLQEALGSLSESGGR